MLLKGIDFQKKMTKKNEHFYKKGFLNFTIKMSLEC